MRCRGSGAIRVCGCSNSPLGIHENPFACPDYDQRERAMITEFLDIDRYGGEFDSISRECVRPSTAPPLTGHACVVQMILKEVDP